jgi:CBS domain-containing protein
LPNGVLSDWQKATKDLPRSAVRRHMTTDVITVKPEARLSELAQTMLDACIHRVIVVDELRKPIGIITSMDILAAVARADTRLPRRGLIR